MLVWEFTVGVGVGAGVGVGFVTGAMIRSPLFASLRFSLARICRGSSQDLSRFILHKPDESVRPKSNLSDDARGRHVAP